MHSTTDVRWFADLNIWYEGRYRVKLKTIVKAENIPLLIILFFI